MTGYKFKSKEQLKEILRTEFGVLEKAWDRKKWERAFAAIKVYESLEEFFENTGWGKDNPDICSEEYLMDNHICRWIDGKLVYLSQLVWESGNGGELS